MLTAPQLLDRVVRHSLAAGAAVSLQAVTRQPLDATDRGGQAPEGLLLILGGDHGPDGGEALVHSLISFPRTWVCRPVTGCPRLLLDVRLRPPLDDALLRPGIPEDERWLFGDPDETPPLRLRTQGAPIPVPVRLAPDRDAAPAAAAVPARTAAALAPSQVTVRTVPSALAPTRVDAVLISDDELPLLRRYLPGRPLGDEAFLAPGPGHLLLLEPAGLAASLPFGVPLRRLGPGACFLETGHELQPPLPPAARARLFGATDTIAVACWHGGLHRFRLDAMIPAWTLWAPAAPPPVSEGVSAAGLALLASLDALLGTGSGTGTGSPETPATPATPPAGTDPGEALERATRLRAQGRLVEAAEAYRLAGDPWEAAQLYEQAATEHDARERP